MDNAEATTIMATESTIEPFTSSAYNSSDDQLQLGELVTTLPTKLDADEQITSTELPNFIDNIFRNENEISKFSSPISTSLLDDSSDVESSSYASYVIPLKIILPIEHVHKSEKNGSFERFNYILLKVDDATYHEHIASDNTDFLFPVDKIFNAPTMKPDSDSEKENHTGDTMPKSLDTDGKGSTAKAMQRGNEGDTILVDSQGYRYELGKHYQIMDEQGTAVVEFDDIEMERPDELARSNAPISKRILSDDDMPMFTTEAAKTNITNDKYEGHYAKIFQWLHFHL